MASDATPWPAAGSLTFPPRTIAVNAKCFPPAAGTLPYALLAAAYSATTLVESPVAGGIFLPAASSAQTYGIHSR